MAMQVKLWGVRGSLPTPISPLSIQERLHKLLTAIAESGKPRDYKKILNQFPDRGGFGGHTTCVEVSTRKTTLIVDGGSGIRGIGDELMKGPCKKGKGEVHLLFTHLHWDHLIGIPFFRPLFVEGNKLHVYTPLNDIEEAFKVLFQKPYFPLEYGSVAAEIVFHHIEPRKPYKIGDIDYASYRLDHPDPCWGYRFEHKGKVYSHCVDTEGLRVSREDLAEDLPLYQGVDLMVFDAQYTVSEMPEKVNWGHASATFGLDIAMREGIKRVCFVHHDPGASDEKIRKSEEQTRQYYDTQLTYAKKAGLNLHEVDWSFVPEGLTIKL
jgi:phosphoribosyl 1,2-cyclic phosphodiesterase